MADDTTPSLPLARVFVSRKYIDFERVLLGVLGSKEDRRAARQVLDCTPADEIFIQFLDGAPKWVVMCEVTDSMVSGTWGLKTFSIGTRSYLYYEPDWGLEGSKAPIIGAWEPTSCAQAFHQCLLKAYASNWEEFCLPPAMGQWATGPRDIMLDALCAILRKNPQSWSVILNRLEGERRRPSFAQLVEATAEHIALPLNLVSCILQPYEELSAIAGGVQRSADGTDITDHARMRETRASVEKACRNFAEQEARVFLAAFLHIINPSRQSANA
jgi:hypothetical protein